METNAHKSSLTRVEYILCAVGFSVVVVLISVSLCLQAELVDLAESIQQKLSYFNELENINTVRSPH